MRWERLSGDTATFAVKLAFAADPHQGVGADHDMAASWGSLQFWVDGINVCAHVDDGETIAASHWYMLPMLEWIAGEWNALFHEEKPPSASFAYDAASVPSPWFDVLDEYKKNDTDDRADAYWQWRERHSVRTARDGGLHPDLFIRRYRDTVELSWTANPVAGAESIRFLAPSGRARMDPPVVADAMYTAAKEAAQYLAEANPGSRRFEALVEQYAALPTTDVGERVAWLAGLGRSASAAVDRWRDAKQQARDVGSAAAREATFEPKLSSSRLVLEGSSVASLLFGSVSPTIARDDVLTLCTLLLSRYQPSVESELDRFARAEPVASLTSPWEQGYQLAIDALELIHEGPDDEGPDVVRCFERLGIDVVGVSLTDRQLRAVSFASPTHRPTVGVNTMSAHSTALESRRFTLAHELCHLLHDRDMGASLAVASGPWAPPDIEKRANAFAAMFLMSSPLVRRLVTRYGLALDSQPDTVRLAELLRVSHTALVRHLANVGLIDLETRDQLRPDLAFDG